MIRRGDPVLEGQWTTEVVAPVLVHHLLPVVGAWATEVAARGHSSGYVPRAGLPLPVARIGTTLARRVQAARPVGCTVHNGVLLGWHRDRLAPRDTWNVTLVLRDERRSSTAGLLVVGTTAYVMDHGAYVHFDNQVWHGVTAFDTERETRVSCTFYVPAP